MKVVRWTQWKHDLPESAKATKEEALKTVVEELRSHEYRFTGDYHQNGKHGVPVFDNGKILQVSMRSWGEIMAVAYPEEIDDNDGFGYLEWAWIAPGPSKIPEE